MFNHTDLMLNNFIKGSIPNDRHQSTITCSKSTIETLEQGVKYVQSKL